MTGEELAEKGFVPDFLIRHGIRQRLREGIAAEERRLPDGLGPYVKWLKEQPIAVQTKAANEQHYEVPCAYFEEVLGPRLKYSSGYWPDGVRDLAGSEEAALALTCKRAQIEDGQRVLDLGCGWGSFTLYAAEHFPGARFTAVSNSRTQKEFIEARAREKGLGNVTVITADINAFEPERGAFDRVVSVEMFEHMRNYEKLLAKVASALKPQGKLFVHIFTHTHLAYRYREEEAGEWMARHFFSGGQMPADSLLAHFQRDVLLEDHWTLNGRHYQQTLEAWLKKHDAAKDKLLPLFEDTYGKAEALKWFRRWRLFYLACSELFGYREGREWQVSHYRFVRR